MRLIPIAAIFAVGLAMSQDDPFLKGDELKAAVEHDCSDGCVTFNRTEAKALQDQIEALVARREKAAFERGVKYQKQACASLVSYP